METHHKFSLLQPLPKEFISEAITKAQGYIGKDIVIKIEPNNLRTTAGLVFYGVITEAQMVRTSGATGYNFSGSHVIYPSTDNSDCIELATDIFSSYNVVQVETTSPKSDVRGLQILSQKSNKTKRKVLVELGFVTSPKDSKALFTNINLIAQQLYYGLVININKKF